MTPTSLRLLFFSQCCQLNTQAGCWSGRAPTGSDGDLIYADAKQDVEAKRKAFIRKWPLKHKPVAVSLEEEAGDKLLTFTRFPPS